MSSRPRQRVNIGIQAFPGIFQPLGFPVAFVGVPNFALNNDYLLGC